MSKGGDNFQDWTPVVLKKNPAKLPIAEQKRRGLMTTARNEQEGKNSNVQDTVINYDEEGNEIVKIPEPSRDMGQLIQTARVSKKMTRKQLANLCNIKESELGEYETGKKAVPGNHKNIISKHLGMSTLKKKPNPK